VLALPDELELTLGLEVAATAGAAFFGAGLSAGVAALALSAVTDACVAGADAAGASEVAGCEDDLDLLAAPIANAAPNATTTAATSSSQRFRTAAPSAEGPAAPNSPCIAALPLSIAHRPSGSN
jgi:hypothetical protein